MPGTEEYFDHYTPERKWLEDDDTDEVILPRPTLPHGYGKLSQQASLTLVLNDICCERGEGKVYCGWSSQREGSSRLVSLPELIYVSMVWSDTDIATWKSWTPRERLYRSSARGGWISDEQPVLPFTLQCIDHTVHIPWLCAFSRARITVMLTPQTYIGYTAKLREVLDTQRVYKKKSTGKARRPIWMVREERLPGDLQWERLTRFKVQGAKGILETLEQMYDDEEYDCLDEWGAIQRKMVAEFSEVQTVEVG